MNDMQEIITMEQANRLFLVLAIAGPIVGLALGSFAGSRSRSARSGAVKGLVCGLFGPLILVLWKVYNAITDHLGLDTVKNLVVNLALFIGLGIVAGLLAGKYARGRGSQGGYLEDGHGGGGSLVGASVGGTPSPRSPGAERSLEDSDQPVSDH